MFRNVLILALIPVLALSTPAARVSLAPSTNHLAFGPIAGASSVERAPDGAVIWATGRMGSLDGGTITAFVDHLGPSIGLVDPANELVVAEVIPDDTGMRHAILHRVVDGLPIVESTLVLHFDASGVLVAMNGRYPASRDLQSPRSAVSAERAMFLATREAGALAVEEEGSLRFAPHAVGEARLVVWPDSMRAAWEITAEVAAHLRWRIYIDSSDGSVIARRNLVNTGGVKGSGTDSFGRTRRLNLTQFGDASVFGTQDTSSGRFPIATTLNALSSWDGTGTMLLSRDNVIDEDAGMVDVHANTRQVLDFYRTKFGRKGWDAKEATAKSFVHFGQAFDNAYWNGEAMYYGDGSGTTFLPLSRCLDVAAHELTHAVVQATAGLVYENQSGALNEHMADTMGVLVDDSNWLIGESCVAPSFGSPALRDMAEPQNGQQPADMAHFIAYGLDYDSGGVHINSGIPNRAAYLVGRDLGREKLGKIWYRVLEKRYLTERSQFLDLRRGAIQACTELAFGTDCAKVSAAFDTVGLFDLKPGAGGCPEGSVASGEYCECPGGSMPDAAGTACVARTIPTCPAASHLVGYSCVCDDGLVMNPDGSGCVAPRAQKCPIHSKRQGETCVCDKGYQGGPFVEGGCKKIPTACPANARPKGRKCECLPGWVLTAGACVPAATGCGNETFFGRCQGETVIHCVTDHIVLEDCAKNGQFCELQESTESGSAAQGYVCRASDGCGSITPEGVCKGTAAVWCEGGEVRTSDCGRAFCAKDPAVGGFTCRACPEHGNEVTVSGQKRCRCDNGYILTSTKRECRKRVPADGAADEEPADDFPAETPPTDEGGCTTIGLASSMALAGLVRRRRRA